MKYVNTILIALLKQVTAKDIIVLIKELSLFILPILYISTKATSLYIYAHLIYLYPVKAIVYTTSSFIIQYIVLSISMIGDYDSKLVTTIPRTGLIQINIVQNILYKQILPKDLKKYRILLPKSF